MPGDNIILTNRHLLDLNPLIAGEEECAPGHSFGPAVRRFFLLHYVRRGRGTYYAYGGVYPVEAGQAFLILPGEVTTYTADESDPWHYQWIGFDGALAERFRQLPPVFSVQDPVFRDIFRRMGDASVWEYHIASGLLRLYAELFSGESRGNSHVKRVENYIRSAYMERITVEQIARQMNLDRRYLSRLFKEKTGQTIQEYLLSVRLEAACLCLQEGRSVQEAAQLCGYEDVSNFSKMFKRRYGKSPAYWKKQNG